MKKMINQIKMWKYARRQYERACFKHKLAVMHVECRLDAIHTQDRALERYREEGADEMALCSLHCMERFGEMLEDDALKFELACEDVELWKDIGTMSLPKYLLEGLSK